MDPRIVRSMLRRASSLSAPPRTASFITNSTTCARCSLHNSATNAATPVAHPTVHGPPPSAPQAAASYAQDRVARKRQQAELLRQGQKAKTDPAKPQTALQKRFWKDVSVKENPDGTLHILLDTRPVRTAQRQILNLPQNKRALATSIALEWDHLVSAQQALKQHYIPLTSLSARALDIAAADAASDPTIRTSLVTMVMRYLSTDTLLCWAPSNSHHDPLQRMSTTSSSPTRTLRERQQDVAAPILAYLTTHVFPGVEFVPILSADSIVPIAQPDVTREVVRGWVSGLPAWELAALERGVLATKSLLVAARMVVEWSSEWAYLRKGKTQTGRFGIEEAAEAATLEVLHQTEQWGEVEDTHDVDREDLRRQLGSVILLIS